MTHRAPHPGDAEALAAIYRLEGRAGPPDSATRETAAMCPDFAAAVAGGRRAGADLLDQVERLARDDAYARHCAARLRSGAIELRPGPGGAAPGEACRGAQGGNGRVQG